jgi:competence protein ComEC
MLRGYLKLWRLGFLLILFFGVFLSVYVLVWEERGKTLAVHFLDVGQGDAIFIVAPNGNQILIDGGPPSGKVEQELAKVMPFYDRSIDLVIATHPDQDHIGGLIGVLNHYKIGAVLVSGATSTTSTFQQLDGLIKEKKIYEYEARRSMRVVLNKDITLSILSPLKLYSGQDTNSASIVSRLVYGNDSYLFMADGPIKVERELLYREGKNIESDVLKAGHHGSKTSSDEAFLALVSPSFTVISSGKNNRYGHPNQEVLDRLLKIKTAVLRTDEKGTITFLSEGRGVLPKI